MGGLVAWRKQITIPTWLGLPTGTPGDSTPVDVAGEIAVAERGPTLWALRAPTTTAQAYVAANPVPPQPPAQVTGLTAAPGNAHVALSWSAASGATSYKLYRTISGSEILLATQSGTTYDHAGLTNGVAVSYRVVATNSAGDATTSATVSATPVALTLHTPNALPIIWGNGMLMEVGVPLIEGAIPAGGRTFTGNFERTMPAGVSNITIYGVEVLLLNRRSTPIQGARMIGGRSQTWNGDYLPNTGGAGVNALTGNPFTGWANFTVDGDPTLPVPAATSEREGAAWARLMFPSGVSLASLAFFWRFWHPGQNLATDYALTYAAWGANDWDQYGVGEGAGKIYNYQRQAVGDPYGLVTMYADGDGCTVPSTILFPAFSVHASPLNLSTHKFGPPGPGSFPFMISRFILDSA